MRKCFAIEFETPKRYLLNGLWFGGDEAKKALVFVQGLGGTTFGLHDLVAPLASEETAVIYFGNRGHDKVAKIKKINRRTKKGYESHLVGENHEVFTDCVDDIQGIVDFLRNKGVKDIHLVGHSTGCQKSIYFLSKPRKQKFIRSVTLLCPISDYASVGLFTNKDELTRSIAEAQKMVEKGNAHDILPKDLNLTGHDAQRFLSLYTPDSAEEIFTYAHNKKPITLQKVKTPSFYVFAGSDEYNDRPTQEISKWFENNSKADNYKVSIIKNALHGFQEKEGEVNKVLRGWLKQFN
ncbi:alpha/beta fold hydrolase [Patescibacteria group bacterium]